MGGNHESNCRGAGMEDENCRVGILELEWTTSTSFPFCRFFGEEGTLDGIRIRGGRFDVNEGFSLDVEKKQFVCVKEESIFQQRPEGVSIEEWLATLKSEITAESIEKIYNPRKTDDSESIPREDENSDPAEDLETTASFNRDSETRTTLPNEDDEEEKSREEMNSEEIDTKAILQDPKLKTSSDETSFHDPKSIMVIVQFIIIILLVSYMVIKKSTRTGTAEKSIETDLVQYTDDDEYEEESSYETHQRVGRGIFEKVKFYEERHQEIDENLPSGETTRGNEDIRQERESEYEEEGDVDQNEKDNSPVKPDPQGENIDDHNEKKIDEGDDFVVASISTILATNTKPSKKTEKEEDDKETSSKKKRKKKKKNKKKKKKEKKKDRDKKDKKEEKKKKTIIVEEIIPKVKKKTVEEKKKEEALILQSVNTVTTTKESVLSDIYQTERDFFEIHLKDEIYTKLIIQGKKLLNDEFLSRSIFSTIEGIYRLHQRISNELEDTDIDIVDIFCESCESFSQSYMTFFVGYRDVLDLWKKVLPMKKKLKKYVMEEEKIDFEKDVMGVLKKRLTYYKTMFTKLSLWTEEGHSDYKNLKKVISTMSSLSEQMRLFC